MQEYLKHKKSLATKRGKKPAVAAASVSRPAVESSTLLGSPPTFPSISEDSKIRDAVLAVLQSLSKAGSLGTNQSSTAPSTVPDYAPSVGGDTGGDGGMKPHNVGRLSRSSGVGALDNSVASTTRDVHHDIYSVYPSSARHSHDLCSVFAAPVAAPLGHPPPLASSGDDLLRVPGHGPLDVASSPLSPNSLLFPLPPSSYAVSSSSSFFFWSPFFGLSFSCSSPFLLLLLFSFLFPSSTPPSFAPSSLSSDSFPSFSSVTSALPPSVSSLFPLPLPSLFLLALVLPLLPCLHLSQVIFRPLCLLLCLLLLVFLPPLPLLLVSLFLLRLSLLFLLLLFLRLLSPPLLLPFSICLLLLTLLLLLPLLPWVRYPLLLCGPPGAVVGSFACVSIISSLVHYFWRLRIL